MYQPGRTYPSQRSGNKEFPTIAWPRGVQSHFPYRRKGPLGPPPTPIDLRLGPLTTLTAAGPGHLFHTGPLQPLPGTYIQVDLFQSRLPSPGPGPVQIMWATPRTSFDMASKWSRGPCLSARPPTSRHPFLHTTLDSTPNASPQMAATADLPRASTVRYGAT